MLVLLSEGAGVSFHSHKIVGNRRLGTTTTLPAPTITDCAYINTFALHLSAALALLVPASCPTGGVQIHSYIFRTLSGCGTKQDPVRVSHIKYDTIIFIYIFSKYKQYEVLRISLSLRTSFTHKICTVIRFTSFRLR